mmetsp:Transcript_32525/g.45110  ORF Transcript_32525/g.45110 Transcript_32525/m.45110 type:complete len:216 (-) Transcript_32525:311-958(-)
MWRWEKWCGVRLRMSEAERLATRAPSGDTTPAALSPRECNWQNTKKAGTLPCTVNTRLVPSRKSLTVRRLMVETHEGCLYRNLTMSLWESSLCRRPLWSVMASLWYTQSPRDERMEFCITSLTDNSDSPFFFLILSIPPSSPIAFRTVICPTRVAASNSGTASSPKSVMERSLAISNNAVDMCALRIPFTSIKPTVVYEQDGKSISKRAFKASFP